MGDVEQEKRAAAEAAAELVEDGMALGLGTGTTVAYLLPALAARGLRLRCVATSPRTEKMAASLGLQLESFDETGGITELDMAIDGADQVDPANWLVKGGGGAHTREKVVATAAARFVVIVSSDKVVEEISSPIPLEVLGFGSGATLRALGDTKLRESAPRSPDGGLIADWYGDVAGAGGPGALATRFESIPGIVGHGLFPPALVTDVLVARGSQVEHRR
jgi:ribose 5-phosphate isomerase A